MSATRVAQPATRNHLRTFYTLILTQALSLIGSRISNLAVGIGSVLSSGVILDVPLCL